MKELFRGALFSIQFLTRIPVPCSIAPNESLIKKALMLFPLCGWGIGLLLSVVWWLANLSGPHNPFALAAIIIAAETLITGAFHLDGLADTGDALFSPGTSRDEKLSIMKDSRIGVMGAAALIVALLLKTALLTDLFNTQGWIVVLIYPVIGRWALVVSLVFSPYVRREGIGSRFSDAADHSILVIATLIMLPCFFLLFFPLTMVALILFFCTFRWYVHDRIGGITGDTLGAAAVLSETVFLLGAALWHV